jgi:hypothetical protein
MADSVVRLTVNSSEYDQKLKRAAEGLTRYADECRKVGGTLEVVEKETLDYVRAIGQMDTTSRTATGKLAEMKKAFVELSAQYKQMTDAEKVSPFGKALSESLNELKPRIMEAKQQLDDINKSMIGASSSSGGGLFAGLGDKMSGALQVFAGNMMTKAAGAVASLGSEMAGMVQQGIELAKQGEGIRIAFERLGRGDILQGLREATHGTVTDLELMKAAVKFNDFKLPVEELGILLQFAQQKAKDTGQSVDYMVDSIVTGLGRKSLMILDNLGLSATEVKERMAETGDMTKAVGEIIREQMSKAGDYVETAEDRATQADVKLKNAMEELGRTFQPLTDAGTSMWSSLKVGALDLLNNAVKPLIQALSEAGALGQAARAGAGFNNLGGNAKVDRMIARLGNGKTQGAYSIYTQQLGKFDEYINNKRFQIAAFGSDNSSVAQSAKAKLQTELDGALKMRAEYVKRAQELHNQVPSPTSPTSSSDSSKGKRGGSKGTAAETFAPDSIAAQQKLVADLTKQWNEAGAEVRNQYVQPLVEAEAKLKSMQNEMEMQKENAAGKLLGGKVEIPVEPDISGSLIPSIDDIRDYLEKNPIKISVEAASDKIKGIMKTASITADVVGSIGDAFNAIEDPAAKVAGTIAQAIASVALGYATATANAGSMGPWAWVAFAATGLAEMLTMISTIHSATGYASGGIVSGNSFSGDNVPAMVGNTVVGLNAGELILNKSQQNNIASQLTQAGGGRLVAKLKGRDILISLERELSETGKGQLATWR